MNANEKRAVLRKAISAHADWEDYRQRHNLTVSSLASVADCEKVCADLGINHHAILADEQADELWGRAAPAEDVEPAPKTTPVKDAPDDLTGALVALKKALGGSVDADAVRAIVEEAIAPLKAIVQDQAPVLLTVRENGDHIAKIDGLRHRQFEKLLRVLSARDVSDRPLNVWLAGPTQSGKTTAAEQAAEALGLPFEFHGAMTMAHELSGFVDGHGSYHETPFVRFFRNGGVMLLDEIDAGSNEALLALNAALANGLMSLPSGEVIRRHKDFVCIGAANTWGAGATAEYIGRAKIDGAFLQRFPVKIFWEYDADLERKFCGNPDFALRVQAARKAAQSVGLKVNITPAHSKAGAALIASGFTEDEAASMTYLAGLTVEQIKQVEA